MIIRKYNSSDCESLTMLFYNTVHYVNSKDYTKEQLDAWASGNADLSEWNQTFLKTYTVVAVESNVLIGFGNVDNTGYLDMLYVHKDYQRKGIATAICKELEKYFYAGKITSHVSITAKPFFENRGYKVVREQQVERKGVRLTNYIMEKQFD